MARALTMHAESLRMDFIPLKHLTEMRQECVELAVIKCSTFLWRSTYLSIFELTPDQDETNTAVPVTCRIQSIDCLQFRQHKTKGADNRSVHGVSR